MSSAAASELVFTQMDDDRAIDGHDITNRNTEDAEERQEQSTFCFCLCTKNLRALWGLFLINTTFALAQLIAAILANSVSLLSDSGSMLVDSFSYLVAVGTERRKIKYGLEASKLIEAVCSLISVALLITVTVITLSESISRLEGWDEEDDETVAGAVVVAFSTGNLIMDVIMCGNYWYQVRGGGSNSKQLNMVAAFVHLFADSMRSITGVIAGSMEVHNHEESVRIDATATFVVCSMILLAASFVLFEAIQQFRSVLRERRQQGAQTEGLVDSNRANTTGNEERVMAV